MRRQATGAPGRYTVASMRGIELVARTDCI
jgi:hypothetical protein